MPASVRGAAAFGQETAKALAVTRILGMRLLNTVSRKRRLDQCYHRRGGSVRRAKPLAGAILLMERRVEMNRRVVTISLALVALAAGGWLARPAHTAQAKKRVLILSQTAGFRHSSIPTAIATVMELGQKTGA